MLRPVSFGAAALGGFAGALGGGFGFARRFLGGFRKGFHGAFPVVVGRANGPSGEFSGADLGWQPALRAGRRT